jgi:thioredoxin-like negative regulator of GroEL
MLDPVTLRAKFEMGLLYPAYVATGTPDQQSSWRNVHARVVLTPDQAASIASWTRRINVLVTSGTWCGDCVQQVPILDHLARANASVIGLRLLDRDEHADLADAVRICGGRRVPTAIFLNEDFEFLGIYGDKALSRLRAIAARSLGAACMLPGAPLAQDELAASIVDWLEQFERAHLIARLSPRLRERHAD